MSGSFRQVLRKLPAPAKSLSVLDIGCGYGEELVYFGPESVGLELDDERIASCRARGLNVLKWSFLDPFPESLDDRRFDVALMSHFLEHAFAPHQLLMEARRHLKPNGLLLMHVPIVNPLMRPSLRLNRIKRLPLGFHTPLYADHVNFYTTKTLAVTCEFAGFETLYLGSPYLPDWLAVLMRPFWPTAWYVGRRIEGFQYGDASAKLLDSEGRFTWKIG